MALGILDIYMQKKKKSIDFYLTFIEINQKWISLNIITKIQDFLRKTVESLHDFELGREFLDTTHKAQLI